MKTDIEGVIENPLKIPKDISQRWYDLKVGDWFMIGLSGIQVRCDEVGPHRAAFRVTSDVPGCGDLQLDVGERISLVPGVILALQQVSRENDGPYVAQLRYAGHYTIPVFSKDEYLKRMSEDHWREDPA